MASDQTVAFNRLSIPNTAATTTDVVSITGNALTSGSALDVTSNSNAKTSSLVNIAQTGVTTDQTDPTLTVSTSATTQGGVASFTGDALTTSDAVNISATSLTTGSALKITGTTNKSALHVANGNAYVKSGITTQLSTVYTTGGSNSPNGANLVNGYMYNGAAGGGGSPALTFPGATAVQTALNDIGITSAAGTKLPTIYVRVTDANDLTVTPQVTETVIGTATINNETKRIDYIFTDATNALIIIY